VVAIVGAVVVPATVVPEDGTVGAVVPAVVGATDVPGTVGWTVVVAAAVDPVECVVVVASSGKQAMTEETVALAGVDDVTGVRRTVK